MSCENERLLFPRLGLIKKEVRERFLEVTRFIYTHHPVYQYLDNEKESEILIQDASAFSEQDGKNVRIVAKVGAYNYHLNDTLGNNFSKEIIQDGHTIGHETKQVLNVPITILVFAYAEEESSDVADELAQHIIYACNKYYRAKGIIPRSVSVSETGESNREQNTFLTTINALFDVYWMNERIDFITIDNIFAGLELPETKSTAAYRQPGVQVKPILEEEVSFKTFFGERISVFKEK